MWQCRTCGWHHAAAHGRCNWCHKLLEQQQAAAKPPKYGSKEQGISVANSSSGAASGQASASASKWATQEVPLSVLLHSYVQREARKEDRKKGALASHGGEPKADEAKEAEGAKSKILEEQKGDEHLAPEVPGGTQEIDGDSLFDDPMAGLHKSDGTEEDPEIDEWEVEAEQLQKCYDDLVGVVGSECESAQALRKRLDAARAKDRSQKPIEVRILAQARRIKTSMDKVQKSGQKLESLKSKLSQVLAELEEEDTKNTLLVDRLAEDRLEHSKLVAQMEEAQRGGGPKEEPSQQLKISKEQAWKTLLGGDDLVDIDAGKLLEQVQFSIDKFRKEQQQQKPPPAPAPADDAKQPKPPGDERGRPLAKQEEDLQRQRTRSRK